MSRILKFGTNVGYDLLYCIKENQHVLLIIPLICPFFFLSNQIFCYKFLNTLRVAKYIVGEKTKLRYILPSSLFSICHSSVVHREICDKYFSGTIAHRIL